MSMHVYYASVIKLIKGTPVESDPPRGAIVGGLFRVKGGFECLSN